MFPRFVRPKLVASFLVAVSSPLPGPLSGSRTPRFKAIKEERVIVSSTSHWETYTQL